MSLAARTPGSPIFSCLAISRAVRALQLAHCMEGFINSCSSNWPNTAYHLLKACHVLGTGTLQHPSPS